MRLKKVKVTVVERGRLVYLYVRGFTDRHSRCQLDQKDITWCTGHVAVDSLKGQALLAADALHEAPVGSQMFFVDQTNGNDANSGFATDAPKKSLSALAAVLPPGNGGDLVINIAADQTGMAMIPTGVTLPSGYGNILIRGV